MKILLKLLSKLKNKKGFTLVEVICVVVIFSMVSGMIFPMFNSYMSNQTRQLKQNYQRLDVQLIKTFMGEDVHYAKKVSKENDYTLKITDNYGGVVRYTLVSNQGKTCFARTTESGKRNIFGEVENVRFTMPVSRLVATELIVDTEKGESYKFDTARWGYRKSLLDFIELEGVFLYSDYLSYNGNAINAQTQSLYIDGDLDTTRSDLNGGAFGNVKKIYVNGDLTLSYGITLGNASLDSQLFVNGDLILSGGANLYGTVYVSGNFSQSGGGNIYANVYINGDVTLSGGPNIVGNMLYAGTLYKPNWMSVPKVVCDPYIAIPAFPIYEMLKLKPREWFEENGYKLLNSGELYIVQSGDRIYVDGTANLKIDNTGMYGPLSPTDVIIACTGQVKLNGQGNGNLTALIFAPEGSIDIQNFNIFTGVMLTSEELIWPRGGSYIIGRTLNSIISDPSQYPFED